MLIVIIFCFLSASNEILIIKWDTVLWLMHVCKTTDSWVLLSICCMWVCTNTWTNYGVFVNVFYWYEVFSLIKVIFVQSSSVIFNILCPEYPLILLCSGPSEPCLSLFLNHGLKKPEVPPPQAPYPVFIVSATISKCQVSILCCE